MAKQTINIGTTANDGTGDPIRAAFGKVNDNFTEIYTANTGVNTGDQNLSAYATTAAVAAGYQPLDSDLTAISALTTTAYGRALLSTADAATLRSAIGVGQTDAPTFLAQTLTGQSLTGVQATSLVDLAATWNTTGTPSALKLNVTDTASNAASKLLDLQVGGVSKVSVRKDGFVGIGGSNGGFTLTATDGQNSVAVYSANAEILVFSNNGDFVRSGALGSIGFSSQNNPSGGVSDTKLLRDAAGILAQRNGSSPQAFRVANQVGALPLTDYDRAVFDFKTTLNTLRIGTENSGTTGYTTARPIDFVTGGVARWRFDAVGNLVAVTDNNYDIGYNGSFRPKNIFLSGYVLAAGGNGGGYYAGAFGGFAATATGVFLWINGSSNDFDRFNLGGTSNANPAIARDGAGIKITGAAAGSTSWIKVPAVAVSALPAAATAGVGARSFVNDALTPVFGSAVTGGGAVTVPVYSTGSAWNVG